MKSKGHKQQLGRESQVVYTIPQLAKVLGKTEQAVRALIRDGKIPVVELGERTRYIPGSYVDSLYEGEISS